MERTGFFFFTSWVEASELMPDNDKLTFFKIIAHYALYDEEPQNITGMVHVAFELARPQIDACNRKYEEQLSRENDELSEDTRL